MCLKILNKIFFKKVKNMGVQNAVPSPKKEMKIIAYIDLLAMSNFVRENVVDSIDVFSGYNHILKTKIIDERIQPASTEKDPNLKALLERTSVSSFDYFLPFSDSIFLASSNPDKFIEQLCHFILSCYLYNADAYKDNPLNPSKPFANKMLGLDGNIYEHNVYPILFRGGLCIGNITNGSLMGRANGNNQEMPVLIGEPVVKAVKMESVVKGPRVILDEQTYQNLGLKSQKYIRKTEVGNYYEVLWPSYHFIEPNGKSELYKFKELFDPAVNLWYAFNHTLFSTHYFALLSLITASTLSFAKKIGCQNEAEQLIKKELEKNGLLSKKDVLLKI